MKIGVYSLRRYGNVFQNWRQNMVRDKWYTLYGHLLSFNRLKKAFRKVKKNGGAPGTDGQTIAQFDDDIIENLEEIKEELQEKSYHPSPVKRVYIDKGNGEKRPLGIPTVKDRVVQQVLKDVIEPIFEPIFLECSYGFRPEMSAHMAIKQVKEYLKEGYVWVVDADIKSYFDTINHKLLIDAVAEKISDGSILNLIGMFLESEIKDGEGLTIPEMGTPQGGVISPLLANIYLHKFDKEMTERGHKLVRYADDWIILKRTMLAGRRIMSGAKAYLQEELKLKMHPKKSKLIDARKESFEFLGYYFRIYEDKGQGKDNVIFGPSYKSIDKFKDKIREITRRNQTTSAKAIIDRLKPKLRGWGNYFGIGWVKSLFRKLDSWIKRRIRMIQLRSWKNPGKLVAILKNKGWKGKIKRISMTSWKNSSCQIVHFIMDNEWFQDNGWVSLTDVRQKIMSQNG